MFFNCCRRNCCCRRDDRYEKDYCNKHNEYDKCNKYTHDKCDYDKKEKPCCRIDYEKDYGWNNNRSGDNDGLDRNNGFNNQSYYGEYNNLGYFSKEENRYFEKDNDHKPCRKEDDRKPEFDKDCYTPNWDNDKDCKCEKDKCDHHNWNKYCKPVKYICIPFDKY